MHFARRSDGRIVAGAEPPDHTLTLTFLGTRGEIPIRSSRHRRHSSLLIERGRARIMIDCGADWLRLLKRIAPTAVVLTHAHADHAAGLAAGAPSPVYATRATWDVIRRFPVRDRHELPCRRSVYIDGVQFTAFPVAHSIRAPAVGFRVAADGDCFFYVPDVAMIASPQRVLHGIDLYIGDGATIWRSMVRKRDGIRIGHAPIIAQLAWCERAGVRRAIFTHCGSPIVRANARQLDETIRELGRQHGIDAYVAGDGDKLIFASKPRTRATKASIS